MKLDTKNLHEMKVMIEDIEKNISLGNDIGVKISVSNFNDLFLEFMGAFNKQKYCDVIFIKYKSNKEIITEIHDLAIKFYSFRGYIHDPIKHDKLWNSIHPEEIGMWNMACYVYEVMYGFEVSDIFNEYLEEIENEKS